MNKLMVVSGNANPKLAKEICACLRVKLGDVLVGRFSEGEIRIKVNEDVRGKDVFVIQPTCPPVNDNLMELLILLDALRRASAKRITAVIPYYGYARQDRKDQPRVPITAKLVANLLDNAGADRVLTMDLHAGQIQGFFDIPVDHLFAINVFVEYIERMKFDNLVVVSPDVGGIKMARAYAKRLSAALAIVDKRRISPEKAEVMNILGEVKDRDALIVDDLAATGGSLVEAASAIKKAGAKNIYAAISHGVLSGNANENIAQSVIKELFITDTIPFKPAESNKKIKVLSVAGLLAEAIRRIRKEESVSSLFDGITQ
ncbi:MAG: phosphoribosylpyrophosphate synthetase [Candidatus Omnitrophica bacterium CG11_big_fil_rev_8_21_14_0_20_42_13]|uniref:Ribose-phosphate pyrophosphokinase n=1 Tax=Candidatus Ghiorseimicrobium undicola TaxID=1974746 RepID=A0A2H0LZL4_9BACT|nr:MAG: phosphoribosylpyrophosphate synthetase [Candidatus Omnitrophica bacterium CG11_big_fil_rev_8_21_14_0_20_42_13]